MKPSHVIMESGTRYQLVEYKGRNKEYQLHSSNYRNRKLMHYERDPYTPYQNLLFKRALYGLSVYSQEEIVEMNRQKRKRIQKVHKRTQRTLNVWKQEIVNQQTNAIFGLFYKSPVAKMFIEGTFTDPEYKNTMSFKSLKLTKKDIIDKLLEHGVLPQNFRELTLAPVVQLKQPRCKQKLSLMGG